jgi:glycerophosphoryl diester phosphodiesterase
MKEASRDLARKVVHLVREAGALDRVALGSYHLEPLDEARELEPRIVTGSAKTETRMALYASYLRIPPRWARYRAFQVPERNSGRRIVSRRFVDLAHAADVAVQVWTVDAREDITRLLGWGVDGIISDRPDVAIETVRSWWGTAPSTGSPRAV